MWFVVLISLLLVADLMLFTFDRYVLSFFMLLVNIGLAWWLIPDVTSFVVQYTVRGLLTHVLPIYLLIGVGVAFVKWILFNIKFANIVSNIKEDFKQDKVGYEFESDADRRAAFAHFWNNRYRCDSMFSSDETPKLSTNAFEYENSESLVHQLTPRAKNFIERITFWVLQWPIVIVSTLISDFLVKIGRHVAIIFDKLFTQLSRAWMRRVVKDI